MKSPDPAIRAVLIYGPDSGLVRARGDALVAAVGDAADPFATVDLTVAALKGDAARLGDEAAALTFTGVRRVVRVREATDALTSVFAPFLDDTRGDALVVVEAGELAKRSTLRTLFEKSDRGAALPCYPEEGQALQQLVDDVLGRFGLTADNDARDLLMASLGSDHGVRTSELEKLALYRGGPGTITVGDVRACIGDGAEASLDVVVMATCSGQAQVMEQALQRVLVEMQPVSVIRAVARHVQRLFLATGLTAGGTLPDKAMDSLRPPVFRRDRADFRRQMRLWPPERATRAFDILIQAELDCKTTGLPSQAICQRALMQIARAASSAGH